MAGRYVAAVALAAGACHLQGDCVAIGRPSHTITLRDAISRQVVSAGARIVVVAGAAVDTVMLADNRERAVVAFERDGPVTLIASRVGYIEWRRDNLVATREGSCNAMQALHVTAQMQRAQ